MPLEIPKSPVRHLHDRTSGFSIPGRLPCLLAVVLGLFAHSEALAQRLDRLELTFQTVGTAVQDSEVLIDVDVSSPVGSPNTTTYSVTVGNAVSGVSVVATPRGEEDADEVVEITYDGAGEPLDPLPAGRTTINVKVTVTSTAVPPEATKTGNYVIQLTRTPDATLADLDVFSGRAGVADPATAVELDDPFLTGTRDRTFAAKVNMSEARVRVVVVPTSGTAEITWNPSDNDNDDSDYVGALALKRNTIVITVKDGVRTERYTITVTRTEAPGQPLNFRATGGNTRVALTWRAPTFDGGEPITGYQFAQYNFAQSEDPAYELTWTLIDPSSASTTSHNVTGLTNGTTYYFRVRAVNVNLGGTRSIEADATPSTTPPIPVLDDPPSAGNARVELSWTFTSTDLSPISGYQYKRRAESSSSASWVDIPNSGARNKDESIKSYTVTGLTNGTTYAFQVRTKNLDGTRTRFSSPSNEVYATPEADAPGVPTGLKAQAGDKEVMLSWSAPADNGGAPITGYEYRADPSSGQGDEWRTATRGTETAFTVTSYINRDNNAITPLMNGTRYYFAVRARNSPDESGVGEESGEVFATPIGKPRAPTGFTATAPAHGGEVKLSWRPFGTTELAPNSKYQYLQRGGRSSDGNWRDIPNSDVSTEIIDGTSKDTYTVTGLANGTTYTFQVRAVNIPGGDGLASVEASATPATTPGAPTLRATAGDEQMTLSWTAPSDDGGADISHYVYQVRQGAGDYTPTDGERFPNSGASTRNHTFEADDAGGHKLGGAAADAITNGTAYTVRVWAVNSKGDGDKSNEVTVTPRATPGTGRTYDISATIDGKSWAVVGAHTIQAVVTVNPAFAAPTTTLYVSVNNGSKEDVTFGPGDTTGSESITASLTSGGNTVALFPASDSTPAQALKVTEVYGRAAGATPDTPANPRATAGDGYVTLSWTVSSEPEAENDRYEYRQKAGTGSYGSWRRISNLNRNGNSRSHRVTGLTSGTYTFQVRALRGTAPDETPSDASNEVTVTLSAATVPPGAPTNVIATPGNAQVTLSWSAPASDGGAAISRYEYKQETTRGGNLGRWTTTGGTGTSYTVAGLTNGTTYYFRVRAVNRVGDGPASVEASTTPALTAIDTTLRTLTVSPGTLTPAFTAAVRSYTVTVGSSVSEVTVAAAPTKSTATRTITPADANPTAAGHQVAVSTGTASIRVRVLDGTTTGDYTVAVTRTGALPAAPTGLAATAGDGEVTLSWTAAASGATAITRYQYLQKTGANAYGPWRDIPNSGASTTSHTVPGLTNGTAYTFRVRAVNSAGAGAASTEATATPTSARLVWAKSEQEVAAVIAAAMAAGSGDDMTLDAGEQIEILGSALFNAAPGVTLSYTAVSSDSDVASAGIIDTVTVTVLAESGRNGGYHHHRHGEPAVRRDDQPSDESARGEHHVPGRGGHRGARARAGRTHGHEPRRGRPRPRQRHRGPRHRDGAGQPSGHQGGDRDAPRRPRRERRHRRRLRCAPDRDRGWRNHGLDRGDGPRGRHSRGPGSAGPLRHGGRQCGRGAGRSHAPPLGCRGAGPAARRPAPAGGLPPVGERQGATGCAGSVVRRRRSLLSLGGPSPLEAPREGGAFACGRRERQPRRTGPGRHLRGLDRRHARAATCAYSRPRRRR